MSDLISREALYEATKDTADVSYMAAMILCAPAVDAVEVVRCGECIHETRFDDKTACGRGLAGGCANYNTFIYGDSVMHIVTETDFCSHGKRRESEVSE